MTRGADPERIGDAREPASIGRLPELRPQRCADRLASAAEPVLGRRPPPRVPARVHAAIAADQRASEVLVCIVQFAAIIFFGAFYCLTPKGFPAEVPFEPVPLALGIYAVFTGVRLWLAVAGHLNRLVPHVSVIVDVALLMLTIWSFHLQYQQPATVYLKAPTLLYVFILIALRAMRFEATYVLVAGLAAIVGWSTLVAYAVLTAGEMQVTRNFAKSIPQMAYSTRATMGPRSPQPAIGPQPRPAPPIARQAGPNSVAFPLCFRLRR